MGALVVGIAAGLLSVVGYTVIQPKLQQAIGLHDTCGVNNLHGMPGILAAIVSAIVTGTAKSDHFPSQAHMAAVYGPRNIGEPDERTAGEQAGFQILCLVASLSMHLAITVHSLIQPLGKFQSLRYRFTSTVAA